MSTTLFLTKGLVKAKLRLCSFSVHSYKIVTIDGISNGQMRGIVFLESTDKKVTASQAFCKLKADVERLVRSHFDAWIDGHLPKNHRYHGFQGEHKACFVFKGKNHRFYGFLYHPYKTYNPQYQICVLVKHAIKTKHETDDTDLIHVEKIMAIPAVIGAIKVKFPEMSK